MCYHSGLILLHRSSLKDDGPSGDLAKVQSRKSAGIIASLLITYSQVFGYRVVDFMVIHSGTTSALLHLAQLSDQVPNIYRSAVRALKSTSTVLSRMARHSGYARVAYDDLKEFALECDNAPANTALFWPGYELE